MGIMCQVYVIQFHCKVEYKAKLCNRWGFGQSTEESCRIRPTCGAFDSSVTFFEKICPIWDNAATSIDSFGITFSLNSARNLSKGEEFSLNPVAHHIKASESLQALASSDFVPRSHLTISSLSDFAGSNSFALSKSRTKALTVVPSSRLSSSFITRLPTRPVAPATAILFAGWNEKLTELMTPIHSANRIVDVMFRIMMNTIELCMGADCHWQSAFSDVPAEVCLVWWCDPVTDQMVAAGTFWVETRLATLSWQLSFSFPFWDLHPSSFIPLRTFQKINLTLWTHAPDARLICSQTNLCTQNKTLLTSMLIVKWQSKT